MAPIPVQAGGVKQALSDEEVVTQLVRLYSLGTPTKTMAYFNTEAQQNDLFFSPYKIRIDQTLHDSKSNTDYVNTDPKTVCFTLSPYKVLHLGEQTKEMSNLYTARGISGDFKVSASQDELMAGRMLAAAPGFFGSDIMPVVQKGIAPSPELADYISVKTHDFIFEQTKNFTGSNTVLELTRNYIRKTVLNEKAMLATIDQDRRAGKMSDEQAKTLSDDYKFFVQRQRDLQVSSKDRLNGATPLDANYSSILNLVKLIGGATIDLVVPPAMLKRFEDEGNPMSAWKFMFDTNDALAARTTRASNGPLGLPEQQTDHFVYLSPVKYGENGQLRYLNDEEAKAELIPQLLRWKTLIDQLAVNPRVTDNIRSRLSDLGVATTLEESFASIGGRLQSVIARLSDNDASNNEAAYKDYLSLLQRMSTSRYYFEQNPKFINSRPLVNEGLSAVDSSLLDKSGAHHSVYTGDLGGFMLLQLALDDSPMRGALLVAPDVPYLHYQSDIFLQGQDLRSREVTWGDPANATPIQNQPESNPYLFRINFDWQVKAGSQLLFHDPLAIGSYLGRSMQLANPLALVDRQIEVEGGNLYHIRGSLPFDLGPRSATSGQEPAYLTDSDLNNMPIKLYVPSTIFDDSSHPSQPALVFETKPYVGSKAQSITHTEDISHFKSNLGLSLMSSDVSGQVINNLFSAFNLSGGASQTSQFSQGFRQSISGPSLQNGAFIFNVEKIKNPANAILLSEYFDNFNNFASSETLPLDLSNELRTRFQSKQVVDPGTGQTVTIIDTSIPVTKAQAEAFFSEKDANGKTLIQRKMEQYFGTDAAGLEKYLGLGDITTLHFLIAAMRATDMVIIDSEKSSDEFGDKSAYLKELKESKKVVATSVANLIVPDRKRAHLWARFLGDVAYEFTQALAQNGVHWVGSWGWGEFDDKKQEYSSRFAWQLTGVLPVGSPTLTAPQVPGLAVKISNIAGLALTTQLMFKMAGLDTEIDLGFSYSSPSGRDPSVGRYPKDSPVLNSFGVLAFLNQQYQSFYQTINDPNASDLQKQDAKNKLTALRPLILKALDGDPANPAQPGVQALIRQREGLAGEGEQICNDVRKFAGLFPFSTADQDPVAFGSAVERLRNYLFVEKVRYKGGVTSDTPASLGTYGITGTNRNTGEVDSSTYAGFFPLTQPMFIPYINISLGRNLIENDTHTLNMALHFKPGPAIIARIAPMVGGDVLSDIQNQPQWRDWFTTDLTTQYYLSLFKNVSLRLNGYANLGAFNEFHLMGGDAQLSLLPFGERGPSFNLAAYLTSPMGSSTYLPSISASASYRAPLSDILTPTLGIFGGGTAPKFTQNIMFNANLGYARTFLPAGKDAFFRNVQGRVGVSWVFNDSYQKKQEEEVRKYEKQLQEQLPQNFKEKMTPERMPAPETNTTPTPTPTPAPTTTPAPAPSKKTGEEGTTTTPPGRGDFEIKEDKPPAPPPSTGTETKKKGKTKKSKKEEPPTTKTPPASTTTQFTPIQTQAPADSTKKTFAPADSTKKTSVPADSTTFKKTPKKVEEKEEDPYEQIYKEQQGQPQKK